MENSLVITQKVKHRLTQWPRNSTPRYISKRTEKKYVHRKICTQIIIAALFIIDKKSRSNPNDVFTEERINKMS